MDPKFNDKSPYKRKREDTEHRGEDHVKVEADIRVIESQLRSAKDCQSHQMCKKGQRSILP